MVSASTLVTTFVVVTLLPFAKLELVLMIHLLPFFDQVPSPKPPSASKLHERICLAAGSHPIHCVPFSRVASLCSTVRVATMKFIAGAHSKETRPTAPPAVSSTHSPITHSSPRRNS